MVLLKFIPLLLSLCLSAELMEEKAAGRQPRLWLSASENFDQGVPDTKLEKGQLRMRRKPRKRVNLERPINQIPNQLPIKLRANGPTVLYTREPEADVDILDVSDRYEMNEPSLNPVTRPIRVQSDGIFIPFPGYVPPSRNSEIGMVMDEPTSESEEWLVVRKPESQAVARTPIVIAKVPYMQY